MEKRNCRLCGRSFPTGRSLGGHMRSHVRAAPPNSSMEDEEKAVSRYSLRENPKKSRRFDDEWPDKVCAKPVKACSSLNSSLGMSRDAPNCEEEDDSWSRGSYEEEAAEMPRRQSYSQFAVISMPARTQRRIERKVAKISCYSSPRALSSEWEEENGALCLLMLSKDTHSVSDLYNQISPIIGFGNKVLSFPSEDEDQRFKKPKVSSLYGKRSLSKHCDSGSGMDSSCKRRRY